MWPVWIHVSGTPHHAEVALLDFFAMHLLVRTLMFLPRLLVHMALQLHGDERWLSHGYAATPKPVVSIEAWVEESDARASLALLSQ